MTDFTSHETPARDVNALPLMHPGRPVGRDDLLKEIYTHIQNRRPVLLYGDSGNGKTAVAAALAAAFLQPFHSVPFEYCDGGLFRLPIPNNNAVDNTDQCEFPATSFLRL